MKYFQFIFKAEALLLLILSLWGCSAQNKNQVPKQFQKLNNLTVYPASAKPAYQISFKKDEVYGSTKKVLIGQIRGVAVDSLGRVFITDGQKMTIDVFEPDGRFLTHLGRKGRGPGEFLSIRGMQIRGNHLYVYDGTLLRESIFTIHPLALKNTILLATNMDKYPALHQTGAYIQRLYVRNNNTYLVKFLTSVVTRNIGNPQKYPKKWQNYNTKGLLYILDNTGKISSKKLFDFKNATRTVLFQNSGGIPLFPFFGVSWTVLANNNEIYQAEPDHFLVKVYSPNGAYLHAFYYPLPRIPLTKKSASEAGLTKALINQMKFMSLPQSWPAITYMKIDNQNRLWIATTVQNMNVYQWWVLKPNGKLIARFTRPRNKPIGLIKNGYMYKTETNKKTGIQHVVRYRITLKPLTN